MEQLHEKLIKYHLAQIAEFTEEELELLYKNVNFGSAKTGIILSSPTNVSTKIWMPVTGILRAYRMIQGRDLTFGFFTQYQGIGNIYHIITGDINDLHIEVASDATFLYFDMNDLILLEKKIPKVEKIRSYIIKMGNINVTQLIINLCIKDLKTRYLELIEAEPELFLQIPQYKIASYLNVKPQSLSRLRTQIKKEQFKKL